MVQEKFTGAQELKKILETKIPGFNLPTILILILELLFDGSKKLNL